LLLDGLFNLCSLFFLGVGELLDRLDVTGSAQINKLERGLHLHHQASVLAEVVPEKGLQDEELFVEKVLGPGAILLFDLLLPHSHELPLFELLEEAQFFYVVVGITFDQPLTQRNELDWGVVLVESKAFAAQSVVLLRIAVLVGGDLQIVGVAIREIGIQIHEYGFLLAFAIQK